MGLILKPGDTLEVDIRTGDNVLLIQRGTRLTVDMVNKLRKFSISDDGVISEHTEAAPKPTVMPKPVGHEATIEKVEKKVDAIKHIFEENLTPGEMEAVAVDTASDIVTDIVKFDPSTCVCINDLRVSDEYTYQHSVDVAVLATMLGKFAGLSKKDLNSLATAGLLHDIGKQRIPNEILNKPSRLTEEEMEIMRTHSVLGYEIAQGMRNISDEVRDAILQHHEKVDGSGYPYAAENLEITTFAKMICIADIYDALTHKRCYKEPMSSAEAFAIMVNAISSYDPQLFVEFFKHITFYPVGSDVILSDGTVWKVIDNTNARKPKVVDDTGFVLDLATAPLQVFGVYSESLMGKWRAMHI